MLYPISERFDIRWWLFNLKVAFFIGNYYKDKIGGAEVQSAVLIDYFLEKGVDIVYVAYGDRNSIEPEIVQENFKLYRVKRPRFGQKSLNYFNRKEIFRLIEKEFPDILYQRGDFHYMDLISRYGSRKGIPVVTGISMERHCYPGKISFNHLLPISLIERCLKKNYFRRSDIIISQTNDQKIKLKKNQGFDSIVIPNGHPLPIGPIEKSDPPTICWVANLKPIKRPQDYLLLCDELKGSVFNFTMVGRGEDDKLTRMVREFESDNPHFRYMGELNLEKTNEIIARSHILVNTSLSEGFSNTFIQAWMRGTLVYSTNADPDGMITREGMGGVSDDIRKLSREIVDQISDEDRFENTSRKVKVFSRNKFNVEVIGDRYLDLFEGLIKKQ